MLKLHYNWKYAFLRHTEDAVIARVQAQVARRLRRRRQQRCVIVDGDRR